MKFFTAILISFFICLITGCSFFTASSGQGTTFQYGIMEGYFESPLKETHNATAVAVKKLELIQVSVKKDALVSVYEVKNAKDDTITINLERTSEKMTKISIKVGLIGDQNYSQAIYDHIKRLL